MDKILKRSCTFVANKVEDIDDLVKKFREKVEKEGGKVFAIQPSNVYDMKPRKNYKRPPVIFCYLVSYEMPNPDYTNLSTEEQKAEEKKVPVVKEYKSVDKTMEKATKWCICPVCKAKWGWDKFPRCQCNNDIPPKEIEAEYKKKWG